jgi:catechol 2,3-dioxygenase-like lactoylglutathione lyase family enzyme
VHVIGAYPTLCVDDVERSVAFYRDLLGLEVTADAGWYVELGQGGPPVEAAGPADVDVIVSFVERHHPSVPAGFDDTRGGTLVSVVVDDVAPALARAQAAGVTLALPCCDEEFGQRHFMAVDPDGLLVDVIQRIPPSLAFRRALAAGRRRQRDRS